MCFELEVMITETYVIRICHWSNYGAGCMPLHMRWLNVLEHAGNAHQIVINHLIDITLHCCVQYNNDRVNPYVKS